MNIGIIGAGNVGTGLGRRLAAAGHRLMLSFSRTPQALAAAAERVGAEAGTPAEAARFGEVVILATPWDATMAAIAEAGDALDGRIVWDTTNPLTADFSGLRLGWSTSAGEAVAAAAPGARVVKAIAPFAELLHGEALLLGGRAPDVFVCGDDEAARATVAGLVRDVGAGAVDAGPLALARTTEPLGLLLVTLAYGRGMGDRIGASLLRE